MLVVYIHVCMKLHMATVRVLINDMFSVAKVVYIPVALDLLEVLLSVGGTFVHVHIGIW